MLLGLFKPNQTIALLASMVPSVHSIWNWPAFSQSSRLSVFESVVFIYRRIKNIPLALLVISVGRPAPGEIDIVVVAAGHTRCQQVDVLASRQN